MAGGIASSSSVASRSGRRRGRRGRLMAEINVTPFVDVMLVLLIVFMVTAPLLMAGVAVELPRTEARALPSDSQPVTITVRADGAVFIQETELAFDELLPQLKALAEAGYQQRIFVRADAAAPYGRVAEVMARISSAGYKNIGLVTDPLPQRSDTRGR